MKQNPPDKNMLAHNINKALLNGSYCIKKVRRQAQDMRMEWRD